MAFVTEVAVNGLIVFFLFLFYAWDLPEGAVGRRLARRLGRPIRWCGLDHDWSMFAPSPPQSNFVVELLLDYGDGTRETVHLDIFGGEGVSAGALSTRHVKLLANLLALENELRPSFCRYLVAQRGRLPSPGEEPQAPRLAVTAVELVILAQPIAPFGSESDPRRFRSRAAIRHPVFRHELATPLRRRGAGP